jgi:excisionase family DNA binding protein
MSDRQKITPAQLAKRWGVDVKKVLGWIHSGKLRAIDVSNGSRPRFKIDEADIEDFDRRKTWRPERSVEKRQRIQRNILQLI